MFIILWGYLSAVAKSVEEIDPFAALQPEISNGFLEGSFRLILGRVR